MAAGMVNVMANVMACRADSTMQGAGVNIQARLTDSSVLLQAAGGNHAAFRDLLHLFMSIFPAMVQRLELFLLRAISPRSCSKPMT